MKECLKIVPCDWDRVVSVLFLFVLLLAKLNLLLKEGCDKKNLVKTLSSSDGKAIFTLLTEVIAFYIKFTIIHVWQLSFQGLILRFFRIGESLSL